MSEDFEPLVITFCCYWCAYTGGLIEPYPFFNLVELEDRIQAVLNTGVTLPFFHIDIDLPAVTNTNLLKSDLVALKQFCQGKGIQFGVIFHGWDASTNSTYYNHVMQLAGVVKAAIGIPPQSIVQSWANAPGGTIPSNLGECQYNTHTRLFLDLRLQGQMNGASFVSQSVPAGPWSKGQQKTVTITMKNTGKTVWQDPDSFDIPYFLAYFGDSANASWPTNAPNGWGVTPTIPASQCVSPQQQYPFTFNVIAPNTAGNYNFRWRMARDEGGMKPFGSYTTTVCRQVQ